MLSVVTFELFVLHLWFCNHGSDHALRVAGPSGKDGRTGFLQSDSRFISGLQPARAAGCSGSGVVCKPYSSATVLAGHECMLDGQGRKGQG